MSKLCIACSFVLLVSISAVAQLQAQTRSHEQAAQDAGLGVEALNGMDVAMQKQIDDKHVAGVVGLIGRQGKVGYFIQRQRPHLGANFSKVYVNYSRCDLTRSGPGAV